jgi:hypothetical protein
MIVFWEGSVRKGLKIALLMCVPAMCMANDSSKFKTESLNIEDLCNTHSPPGSKFVDDRCVNYVNVTAITYVPAKDGTVTFGISGISVSGGVPDDFFIIDRSGFYLLLHVMTDMVQPDNFTDHQAASLINILSRSCDKFLEAEKARNTLSTKKLYAINDVLNNSRDLQIALKRFSTYDSKFGEQTVFKLGDNEKIHDSILKMINSISTLNLFIAVKGYGPNLCGADNGNKDCINDSAFAICSVEGITKQLRMMSVAICQNSDVISKHYIAIKNEIKKKYVTDVVPHGNHTEAVIVVNNAHRVPICRYKTAPSEQTCSLMFSNKFLTVN